MPLDPVSYAQDIICQKSISGEVDKGALDVLEHTLTELGFVCHRIPFEGDGSYRVDNLYAHYAGSPGGRHLCFAGHTDVVPVGDVAAWSVDPFSADIVEDELIGRGAVDMKGAIACWVAAISRVLDSDTEIGSLSLLITGDEEADAVNGTVKMLDWLKERGEQIDHCVVGEPTNPKALGDMIKIGRRGSLGMTLTVKGIQGHVAYPDVAHNPVTDMVQILSTLSSRVLDEGTEFFPPSNLEITSVDVGNSASNVIPAQAVARFNIRYNDLHSKASLLEWIEQSCQAVTSDYSLQQGSDCEVFITPPGEFSQLIAGAVEQVTGRMPKLSTTGGTSDARFIKDICTVVECGLINETAHKVDERIAVHALNDLTDIYEKVIMGYFA